MNRTMITSTNTMNQLQQKMDIISNNMSNIQTNGYKRKETYFNDLLVQQVDNQTNKSKEIGRLTPLGIRQGNGAKLSQSQLVLTQGAIKNTDRNLDIALKKEDLFFKVRVSDEKGQNIRYTRDGAFYLSPAGGNAVQLVNGSGYPVLDSADQPIVITGDVKKLTISENGQIAAEKNNGTVQNFDLGVVSLKKPQFMEQIGENLLGMPANLNRLGAAPADIMTSLTGGLRSNISMQQGALETSNVDLSKEMTDLMGVQRQYQFQSKAVTVADQMMGLINGIR
ncbi:flagellar basal-body rod protein FlgG [Bacillus sp. OV322]|uniref:flagellar hook-basal body protein n=1 Tax=Bacillus sp. OV322 TaxID=1882764 RepID=UPI0008E31005|nr:flagellar hook-basal body protein [Bacillus sp. OV322]SFC22426.1 flagellar basal-body rod protein FlgG [Bacillus sp. OV322]